MREINKNDTYVQFKYPHLMWDVHPSYWSYLMITVCIILLNNNRFYSVFKSKTSFFLLFFFNLNLFYLSARVPIVINVLITVISITYYFRQKIKFLLIFYLSIFFSITIAYFQLPFLRYKIQNISQDERFFLWDIAYEKVEANNFILGEGFGLSKLAMKEDLKFIDDPRKYFKGTEIHNQYLTVLLETGILGVCFLIFIYLRPCILINDKYKITTTLPLFSIFLIVFISSIIEPFFSVIKGIIIFSIFSALFKEIELKNKINEN